MPSKLGSTEPAGKRIEAAGHSGGRARDHEGEPALPADRKADGFRPRFGIARRPQA